MGHFVYRSHRTIHHPQDRYPQEWKEENRANIVVCHNDRPSNRLVQDHRDQNKKGRCSVQYC
eukprot:13099149-Ditylum_brightwellii.AAC.1